MSSKLQNNFSHVLDKSNYALWMSLAFHAGYLNAGGFLASHRFVSHMTGFGTQIGVSFGESNYLVAFEMILAPFFFMLGAGFSGFLVDRRIINEREPRIIEGVLFIILMNVLILTGGELGLFGTFGEPLLLQRDFLLLFMLTFTCGLQNGMFVSITAGQVRTTHITGLTTDIGLNLVRIFSHKAKEVKRTEVRKNWLRFNTVLCFSVGSFISTIVFNKFEYWGFGGSTLISIFSLGLAFLVIHAHKPMIKKA